MDMETVPHSEVESQKTSQDAVTSDEENTTHKKRKLLDILNIDSISLPPPPQQEEQRQQNDNRTPHYWHTELQRSVRRRYQEIPTTGYAKLMKVSLNCSETKFATVGLFLKNDYDPAVLLSKSGHKNKYLFLKRQDIDDISVLSNDLGKLFDIREGVEVRKYSKTKFVLTNKNLVISLRRIFYIPHLEIQNCDTKEIFQLSPQEFFHFTEFLSIAKETLANLSHKKSYILDYVEGVKYGVVKPPLVHEILSYNEMMLLHYESMLH